MAANDIAKLTLKMIYVAQLIQLSLHFRFEDAAGTLAGLATDYRDNVLDTIRAATVGAVTYTDIVTEQIASGVPPSTAGPFQESNTLGLAAGTTGTLAGEGIVPQAPAVFTLRTGLKGRRYRGRFFVSGGPEVSPTAGRWDAGQQALWQAHADDLVARYAAAGPSPYTLVVWSPEDLTFVKKDGTPAPRVGNLATTVTSIVPSNFVKTLRRRAVGVGR